MKTEFTKDLSLGKNPTNHAIWEAQGLGTKHSSKRVLEDPELIGKAITICEAKEMGRMAGADGMQTAIRQYRQIEIILARPRQGDSGSSKRECSLPCPTSTNRRPSSPMQQAV